MQFPRSRHGVCLGVMLTLCVMSSSQALAQLDSLLIAPFKEQKSFTYGLHNRRTTLLDQNRSLYGLYMGIQYGERLKHVITLNSNIFWAGQEPQLRLDYAGFAEEFTFLRIKRCDFICYTHAGLGFATYRSMLPTGQYLTNRELVSPIELGIHASCSVWDWLKVKGGVGYRFVLLNEIEQLNSSYYKIGFSVNIRKLRDKLGKFSALPVNPNHKTQGKGV